VLFFHADKFWDYYSNVTKGKNDQYRRTFYLVLYNHGGVGNSTSAEYVKNNLSQICKKVKIGMLTAEVPPGIATSILIQFKKWVAHFHS